MSIHKYKSDFYPIMNPVLHKLNQEVIEKLPNNPSHLEQGFVLCYYNHKTKTMTTESFGNIPIDKFFSHVEVATTKVTHTLSRMKKTSDQVMKGIGGDYLEAGAIKIHEDCAGVSGHGIVYEPLVCEAISVFWLIARDLYHQCGPNASQEIGFWNRLTKQAIHIQTELSPQNRFISEMAELINPNNIIPFSNY